MARRASTDRRPGARGAVAVAATGGSATSGPARARRTGSALAAGLVGVVAAGGLAAATGGASAAPPVGPPGAATTSNAGASAAPAVGPTFDQAMTRQLPQDITVAVRGRTVSVHFGSLRRRAVRTATIRFTRPGAAAVVRRRPASGTLRLTAPKGSSKVRLSVPRTQEWTPTTITRSIRR